jgi:hypothetical protein
MRRGTDEDGGSLPRDREGQRPGSNLDRRVRTGVVGCPAQGAGPGRVPCLLRPAHAKEGDRLEALTDPTIVFVKALGDPGFVAIDRVVRGN